MGQKHALVNQRSRSIVALRKLIRLGCASALALGTLCLAEMAIPTGRRIANAQVVTTDRTTGTQVETISPSSQSSGGFVVTGGSQQGANLFHSFETFSPNGAFARFDLTDTKYDAIRNIFSRVTGSNSSIIDGLLEIKSNSSPNLFLINPNGISIGSNARINIPASFLATTADSLSFSDDTIFSASDKSANPMLTISAPIGLQFGNAAAPITVTGFRNPGRDIEGDRYFNPMYFQANQSVTLLGGDITVTDSEIGTSSGLVQLGSVAANSQVDIDEATHRLTYRPSTTFKDIKVEGTRLNVGAIGEVDRYQGASGDMSLQGRTIEVSSSNLVADNAGSEDGGTTQLIASEDITIENSRITTTLFDSYRFIPSGNLPYTLYSSEGRGGSIAIAAGGNLSVLPTTKIGADTYSDGAAGDITIN